MVRLSWFAMVSVALCWLFFGGVAHAAVLASLDRTTVEEGGAVQLTLSVEGGDGEPDIAPLLHDFEILSRSQSSQFSFMNGHGSSKKSWVFTLMPRHSGVITIPAITVGSGRSTPLSLRVLAAGSAPQSLGSAAAKQDRNIFVEASISPKKGWVQQQFIYTVRLFRAVNLSQAQMSDPKVEHAVVVRLGKDRNYESVRSGRRFVVTERRYAIFPQRRGRMTIAPLRFDGQMVGGGSLFDPFNSFGQVVRRLSNRVQIEVEGTPASWRGGGWLPASALHLSQTLSAEPYRVGEPITRTIELRADGLTAAQLPPILNGVLPADLKRYPDQPQSSDSSSGAGVVGVRREKVALIPLHGGNFILPGIDVYWWSVATGKIEVASVAPRTIHVEGAPAASSSSSSAASNAPQHSDSGVPSAPSTMVKQGGGEELIWWQGAVVLLLLLWLGTLALWWRACRTGRGGGVEVAPDIDSDQQLRQQIESACCAEDGARAAQLLSQWLQQLRQRGVDVEQRFPQLMQTIDDIYRQRYGGGGGVDYPVLQRQFAQACADLDAPIHSSAAAIPSLYS
ncbi:MAG: BatD family protein [Mariprofundales bacterium]|nr:BatD family protein [Mariprofundales bacterium]